jgi:hypothetical protein
MDRGLYCLAPFYTSRLPLRLTLLPRGFILFHRYARRLSLRSVRRMRKPAARKNNSKACGCPLRGPRGKAVPNRRSPRYCMADSAPHTDARSAFCSARRAASPAGAGKTAEREATPSQETCPQPGIHAFGGKAPIGCAGNCGGLRRRFFPERRCGSPGAMPGEPSDFPERCSDPCDPADKIPFLSSHPARRAAAAPAGRP